MPMKHQSLSFVVLSLSAWTLACGASPGAGARDRDPSVAGPANEQNPGTGVPISTAPGTSAGSGALWSDPNVWGGAVPGPSSDVTIGEGSSITLDVSTCVNSLDIRGELVFADRDLTLCARWIMVSGHLAVGSEAAPFSKRAVITLLGDDPTHDVMAMGTKFLGTMGAGRIDLHGLPATSWTTLAGPAASGATSIEVVDATGWSVGDVIAIGPGSHEPNDAETRTITGISGTTLTLDQPLSAARPGDLLTIDGRQIDLRAPVGRLTRNIVIEGDESSATSGFGGHTMIMAGGSAFVRGVEFRRMGQFDQLGRYPFHWHIAGDITGQYIEGSSVHSSLQRGIVVHSSQRGLVRDNVVFNSIGHSYLVETPQTTDNVFERNLAMRVQIAKHQEPTIAAQNDHEAAGFWLRSARNELSNNFVAGSIANGFWYDHTADGPALFRNNVASACAGRAHEDVVFLRQSGLQVQNVSEGASELEFDGLLAYNNDTGVWPAENGVQTYRNFVYVGSTQQAVRSETTGGGIANFYDNMFVSSVDPNARGAAAFALQYGGTAYLENPTFVGYGDRVLFSTHDVDRPWTGDIRFKNVKLIDTVPSSTTVQLPDIGAFEALDDTFLPKGFYIPVDFPELVTPDMVRTTIGGDEPIEVFYGPKRNIYGELVTFLGGEGGFADEGSGAEPYNVAALPLHRSDGYDFSGIQYSDTGFAAGYSVICNSAFSYRLHETPPDSLFAIALDLLGGNWQTPEPIRVTVAIPLPSAPTSVSHMGRTGGDQFPNFENGSATPLTAAASLTELEAGAGAGQSYFYDGQLLHLRVGVEYTLVQR